MEIFQDAWTLFGCKTCQTERIIHQEQEDQICTSLPLDEKIDIETTIIQKTPKLSRDLKDTRPPVYV